MRQAPPAPRSSPLVVGTVAWVVFTLWLHVLLIGVRPFGGLSDASPHAHHCVCFAAPRRGWPCLGRPGAAACMTRIAVIDFETTGISPAMGDRATEVAIVMMEGGRVVDRFQSLMNAGVRIPSFITQLTGITNAMVANAPPAAQVMAEAGRFVG
jgi:hypothetical protein